MVTTTTTALQRAFDAWLAHQRLAGRLRRGASETVYRAMWRALADWCQAQRPALALGALQAPQLLAYLASRTGLLSLDGVLTPRYQQRLVSLVRRVQAHRAWLRLQAGTPATVSATLAPATTRHAPLWPQGTDDASAPPAHLLPSQVLQVQALVTQAPGANARWQTQRDRCAVALQLGAGLNPGDVRALRLVDVLHTPAAGSSKPMLGTPPASRPATAHASPPATWLHVPATGSAAAHTAPLAGWAAAVLARWLAIRQAQALAGPWLLPSTRSGKPWGKVAQYEAARRVLAGAGLQPDGGGSFRLRHSFALRQLQHGHGPDTVAGWLGVVDPQVMLRYQRALGTALVDGSAEASAQSSAKAAAALPWPV